MVPPSTVGQKRKRIIIDTDPGIDDVLAILLALAATADELEIVLISVTFGNIEVRSCLRNIVSIFHVLDKELEWRRQTGYRGGGGGTDPGFEGMTKFKPLVAVGAEQPLQDRTENADYFHGRDGLGGIHSTHPHLSPEETWKTLFETSPADTVLTDTAKETLDMTTTTTTARYSFTPSLEPAHKEILRILKENEPDTVIIVAIGPLTNCAIAAAEDPETFLRVKEVVTMGGAVDVTGNVSPVAEFNVFADAVAAARVYALTSPTPSSTMPPSPIDSEAIHLPSYPKYLPRQLKLTLFALDITSEHCLSRRHFTARAQPLVEMGSPLAEWMTAFMTPIFSKMESLHIGHVGDGASIALHDPCCIWYILTHDSPNWSRSNGSPEDIRVDTTGQWTKGMTLVDRRARHRRNSDGPVPHDRDNWLGSKSGNRVDRMIGAPGAPGDEFASYMLGRIFG